MNVVPLIFFSIVSGIASMSDMTKLKKIGIKTVLYYIITTIIAAAVGLLIANTAQPGKGLDMSALVLDSSYEAEAMPSITSTLADMFPSNIISSMAEETSCRLSSSAYSSALPLLFSVTEQKR